MESEDDGEKSPPKDRPRIFWRARDSLYFAPLVALAIVILLVVSMYAYTGNWPPVYVVESDSMQHGYSDVLGIINTGDLVLAQRIANSSITTYVVGAREGYSTYGEYGDVLLYYANGVVSTPIIHRAIVWLQWVPAVQGYTAYGLAGQPCGNATNAVYATPGTRDDCGLTDLTNKNTLDLYNVGWSGITVDIALEPSILGNHSGYITIGDNNFERNSLVGEYDQGGLGFDLSQLVEPGWIVGVARGMIPWVGALKLWLEGSSTASEIPPQSWQFLGLSFAGIILLAFGLHYALRAEGVEDPRRKEHEEEEAEEYEHREGDASRARRLLRALRPWGRGDPDDEEANDVDDPPPRRAVPKSKAAPPVPVRHGRPRPKVRRPDKHRKGDDDEDND